MKIAQKALYVALSIISATTIAAEAPALSGISVSSDTHSPEIVQKVRPREVQLAEMLIKKGVISNDYQQVEFDDILGQELYITARNDAAYIFTHRSMSLFDKLFEKMAAQHKPPFDYSPQNLRQKALDQIVLPKEKESGGKYSLVCAAERQGAVHSFPNLEKELLSSYDIFTKNTVKKSANDVIKGVGEEDYASYDCGNGQHLILVTAKRSYGFDLSTGGKPEVFYCGKNSPTKDRLRFLPECSTGLSKFDM